MPTKISEPAGVWLRVSSGGQDEQSQEPEDLAWCDQRGYDVRVTYTVHGGSAFKGNRKFDQTWAQVLADIKSGVIRVLVVWKQDRLDRKLATFQMLAQVVEAGGRVEFVTQPHLNDLTTMGGRIALKVEEEIAHAESQTKSDRNRIKIADLHATGSLHGRPCWGYEVACTQACGKTGKECKHVKTLRATPEGLKYVPEVYRRIADGKSLAKVAEWLEAETGRKWWAKSVLHLVRRTTYMGHRTDASGRTILTVPELVDADLWAKANARLDADPRKPGPRLAHRAMLTGVITCARCGSPMYRLFSGGFGHGPRTVWYRCRQRGSDRKSCGMRVRCEQADAAVDLVASQADMHVMERRFVPGNGHQVELAEVEFKIRQLMTSGLDGDWVDKAAALKAEQDRLRALEPEPGRVELTDTGVTYAQVWAAQDDAWRSAWLRAQGFTVTASRERVTVGHPVWPKVFTVELSQLGELRELAAAA